MTDAPKKKISFETIASVSAIVIGVSALFVAWDQAQIMRKQQHASVLPAVNVTSGFSTENGEHIMTVWVRNDGIGPAIIESAKLVVDGEEVLDWPDLRDRFLPEALRSGFQSSLDSTVGILAAGERIDAIRLHWRAGGPRSRGFDTLKARAFAADPSRTYFGVCYCSVFERCWRTGGAATRPERVKTCDDSGEDIVARLLQTISDGTEE